MAKFFKVAVTLDELRRANETPKKSLIRGRVMAHQTMLGGFTGFSLRGGRRQSAISQLQKTYIGPLTLGGATGPGHKGKIIAKGDLANVLRGFGVEGGPSTPKGREMLNRITLEHEGYEGKAIRRLTSRSGTLGPEKYFYTHGSPEVILKEHNLLTSLQGRGEDIGPVKNIFAQLRQNDQSSTKLQTVIPGYEHGRSQRLSRHAIKRITQNLERGQSVAREVDMARNVKEFRAFATEQPLSAETKSVLKSVRRSRRTKTIKSLGAKLMNVFRGASKLL